MKFSLLAEAFQEIESTTKRLEMTDYLVKLLKQTPKTMVDKVVYLTQGKLYPDYVGVELGVAEKLAYRAVASAVGRSEKDVEADYKKSGDLGLSVEKLLKRKAQATLAKKPLAVETVYETLDKIAHASGAGSVEAKIRLFSSLLSDASPSEARYVVRMALGKLRLGIADMTILDALAVAYVGQKESRKVIERAYNLSSDLGHVARIVADDGIEALGEFKITIGRPIRSMAAERLSSSQEIVEKLGGRCAAEYKYDGLRIQAHISRNVVHLFSRRLENITEQFPDVAKHLQANLRAREAIMEAECVAVDPNTGELYPFQMISQRRGRKYDIEAKTEEIPVAIFLFDALLVDGKDLTLLPYLERRRRLAEAIAESENVKLAQQLVTDSAEELETFLDTAVSSGCEGLVVKSISDQSIYQAGARGWLWIKYKRSYKAAVMDTFDLVPVGAFQGRGKRAGSYGALLMATYNPKAEAFETICKLGSGFTDEDLASLPSTMKKYTVAHRHPRVQSTIEPDVWFTPSVVLEVAADEITLSPLHRAGWDAIRKGSGLALRFPRFTGKWRTDKSPEDATTTQEVIGMYGKQLKKIEAEA